MSLASETIGGAADAAPKRPAKPPKPAKLISPSTSPSVPSHSEETALKSAHDLNGTNHHELKDADQPTKPNSASNSTKPNVPPRGLLDTPSPTLTRQEPSSPSSSTHSAAPIQSEPSYNPEKSTLSLDAPPSRRSNPPIDFITLPGTPGTEQDDPASSPLHSPTAAAYAENKSKPAELDSTAAQALTTGTKASRPPPAAAKDGRALPARPKTLRRENRSASVAAPTTNVVIPPPNPLKLTSSGSEIPAAAEIIQEKPVVAEQHFEVVLSANSPRLSPTSAEMETIEEEKPEFDILSPFGIEEMSEAVPQNSMPRKAVVRIPLPPTTNKLATESRQQRSHSVSSFHDGKRIIPLPPQTTPSKVAPLVIPHISTPTIEHEIDKDEREAEKRAKKERKDQDKLERRDSDSSANNSSAVESNDKLSGTESGPIPAISTPEPEKRTASPDVSRHLESSASQPSKDKKEKDKEKEREKDREKEHSKGIFSKFTGKLKGKKHPKSDDESSKGVHFAEPQPSVLDSDEEGMVDPLLDRDPLTPAVTPREGYMIESAMPSVTVTKSDVSSEETSVDKSETPSSSHSGDVSELEAHKGVLKAQIKSMEELHARLKATIAEEQQVLVDTRRSARSGGGRVTGHTKNRSNDIPGAAPLEVPNRNPSPAPNHKIFTSHRFASMAGFTLKSATDGNPESLLGFKQKISETNHGAVYACRHYQSGKMVSVRIVPSFEDTVKQLSRRMEEIKALDHENLARVLAVWPVAAELWLVTEYCPVGSLRTLLDSQCMHLQESALASITKSCLAALNCLHSANLHHGKLSLSNILIDSVGKVKICDFMLKDYLEPPTLPKLGDASPLLTAAQEDIKSLGMAIVESIQGPIAAGTVIDASWKLNKSESYSAELNAFLLACLTDPKPETTAEKLLQHPFITSSTSNQVLIDILADTLVKIRTRDGLSESSSHYPTRTRLEFDQAWAQASATRRKSSFLTLMPPTSASPRPPSVSISSTQKLEKLKEGLNTLIDEVLKDASVDSRATIQHLKESFTRLAEEALRE